MRGYLGKLCVGLREGTNLLNYIEVIKEIYNGAVTSVRRIDCNTSASLLSRM